MKRLIAIALVALVVGGCNDSIEEDSPDVRVVSFVWVDEGAGDWSIAGTVKNKGDLRAYVVSVTAKHYNAAGTFLGEDLALTSPSDIGGGNTATFDIYCGILPVGYSTTRLFTEWVE